MLQVLIILSSFANVDPGSNNWYRRISISSQHFFTSNGLEVTPGIWMHWWVRGRRLFTSWSTAFDFLVWNVEGLDHVIKFSQYDVKFCGNFSFLDRNHHSEGGLTRFS